MIKLYRVNDGASPRKPGLAPASDRVLFLAAPIAVPAFPAAKQDVALSLGYWLEPTIDSSRYFVLRAERRAKGSAGGSTQRVFLGIGFRERTSAMELRSTVAEHLSFVRRHRGLALIPNGTSLRASPDDNPAESTQASSRMLADLHAGLTPDEIEAVRRGATNSSIQIDSKVLPASGQGEVLSGSATGSESPSDDTPIALEAPKPRMAMATKTTTESLHVVPHTSGPKHDSNEDFDDWGAFEG